MEIFLVFAGRQMERDVLSVDVVWSQIPREREEVALCNLSRRSVQLQHRFPVFETYRLFSSCKSCSIAYEVPSNVVDLEKIEMI